jgi:hypothetical protein
MVEKIKAHAEDARTKEAIADGTYSRQKPKSIYVQYSDDFIHFFGEEKWSKKSQNAVSNFFKEFNLPSEKEMKDERGKIFMMFLDHWIR